jgi:hypothetical protein
MDLFVGGWEFLIEESAALGGQLNDQLKQADESQGEKGEEDEGRSEEGEMNSKSRWA